MMGSFPMVPQLPGGWAHCLAEATAIRTTELASPCSMYRLTVLKLSRFFSRYILSCDLCGILFLGQLYTQHINVVTYYPLTPFVLSQLCWVDVITKILHLKFIINATNSLLRSSLMERDKLPPLQIALSFCLICWCVNSSHQHWCKVLLHPLDERLVLVRCTDLRDDIVDFSFERDLCMLSLR